MEPLWAKCSCKEDITEYGPTLTTAFQKRLAQSSKSLSTDQTTAAVHRIAADSVIRKQRKKRWLYSPIHVSSHGQWWSKRRTHRPQSSQCRARRGCLRSQQYKPHHFKFLAFNRSRTWFSKLFKTDALLRFTSFSWQLARFVKFALKFS